MRVFSVEMLVKEEGAAVVEAALKRLKNEANAVAAQMKTTTSQVTTTGRAMQQAGAGTQIAGDRAAKAAIGFAAVGQAIGRTGSLTADSGTRIIEAGSQVAMMFGPKGLAVAAILSFATFAMSKFRQSAVEAEEMAKKFEEALARITNAGDKVGILQQMRELEQGKPSGALDTIINIDDGLIAVRNRIAELNRSGFVNFNRANREELRRLNQELEANQRNFERLRTALMAPMPTIGGGAAPVRITATAVPSTTQQSVAAAMEKAALSSKGLRAATGIEVIDATARDFGELLRVRIPEALAPPIADVSAILREKLSTQVASSIRDGFRSGLEAALATGDIRSFTQALAQTLNSALSKSLTSFVVDGFDKMFTHIGKRLIKGLANMMADFAAKSIVFGKMMEAIKSFLSFGNGLGAVLAATALLAFANANGGKASMGSRTVAGGTEGLMSGMTGAMPTQQIIFGATSATTAAGMTPRSSTNVTIIGPNDPTAQRAMQELLTKANSRGRVG